MHSQAGIEQITRAYFGEPLLFVPVSLSNYNTRTVMGMRGLKSMSKTVGLSMPCPERLNGGRARQDLLNIARTTLSSKILTHDKDHFAELAVDAVLRLRGSGNLEAINILKKPGGTLRARPWTC